MANYRTAFCPQPFVTYGPYKEMLQQSKRNGGHPLAANKQNARNASACYNKSKENLYERGIQDDMVWLSKKWQSQMVEQYTNEKPST